MLFVIGKCISFLGKICDGSNADVAVDQYHQYKVPVHLWLIYISLDLKLKFTIRNLLYLFEYLYATMN